MTSFLKSIKGEIVNNKRVWVPTLIISVLCVLFSIGYGVFKMRQDQTSTLGMIFVVIGTLVVITLSITSVVYFVHTLPRLKPITVSIILSSFLTLFAAGKIDTFEIDTFLKIAIDITIFIIAFIGIYKSRKVS